MPSATPAPAPSAASAPGTLLPADLTSPNFLAQFKSALKTLAKVVAPPQLTPHPATDPTAAPLMSAVSDKAPEAAAAIDKAPAKSADSLMPDLLVQLGFTIVPTAFPVPTPTTPVAAATGPASAATGQPLLQPVAQAQVPQSAAPQDNSHSLRDVQALPATPVGQPLAEAQPAPASPDAKLVPLLSDAPLLQALPDAQLLQALPQLPLQTAPLASQPLQHLKPTDQPQSPTPAVTPQPALATAPDLSATVILPNAPAAHQPPAAAPAATAAPLIGLPQQGAQGGSQSSTARSDHGRRTPAKIVSISSKAAIVQSAPASDAAMVAAAATTAAASAGPVAVPVGPSEVATQIANHADLIRLPGNRGLHIQLHPEDLGGVEVTVRYSPGGGVELHINAEHAATGALVQAGWTELRDALATHGISADRLMLSVTSNTGAGQADLSGGGGNRSDPNSYSSNSSSAGSQSLGSADGQGQGQSRQDNAQQRTSQTWRGGLEPIASTDDNPRVASTTAGPSRIDYRV